MAKTLQKYLLKELLKTFIPSLLCFELLMLLGFSIQMIHKGLDIPSLIYVLPYMALYAIPHVLPTSLLTSTVMTYGRLSANNEITAIRTSGIHLHNIITPIIIAGAVFSLATLYLNAELLPKSYLKVRQLQDKAVKQVLAKHFLTAKKKINFHPYQIYISNVEDGVLKNIAVFEYAKDYIVSILLAEEGEIEINEIGNLALLTLRRGEFVKPNRKSDLNAPTMGNFEEATFGIPLRQRVRNTSLKYTTLTNLIIQKEQVDLELENSEVFFEDAEETIKDTNKEISKLVKRRDGILRELQNIKLKIKQSEKSIAKQEKVIKRASNDIGISKNYIKVANNNIYRMEEKKRNEDVYRSIENIETVEDKEKRDEAYQKKVSLVNRIVGKEKRRIRISKRKVLISKRSIKNEVGQIENLKKTEEGLNNNKDDLKEEHGILSARIGFANKQVLKRDLSLNIHKRLSPALSCLTFILVGIPLGIMTKSSNMLISLGVSFVLILFFYYPLVATGIILADNLKFPIIPSLWGANAFNFVVSMVLFRSIFKK